MELKPYQKKSVLLMKYNLLTVHQKINLRSHFNAYDKTKKHMGIMRSKRPYIISSFFDWKKETNNPYFVELDKGWKYSKTESFNFKK